MGTIADRFDKLGVNDREILMEIIGRQSNDLPTDNMEDGLSETGRKWLKDYEEYIICFKEQDR